VLIENTSYLSEDENESAKYKECRSLCPIHYIKSEVKESNG
jgi:hypothetical protein